jgi:MFS family permease
LQHRGAVRDARFSPEGFRVVTASEDQTARLWDARTGRPITEPFHHRGTVWSAVFVPDGTRVLTSSSDRTAAVWDVRPGGAIGATAMFLGAIAPDIRLAYLAALLYGIGGGVFIAVDWALMTDIIPRASSGRYMGLSNVATGASGPVSVAAGGIIADVINRIAFMGAGMRVSLVVALVLYVLAAAALRPVVEPRRNRPASKPAAPVPAAA